MIPSKLIAVATAAAGLVLVAAPPVEAKTRRPYEAIAGHYPTVKQANAMAARARSKGFKVVVQPNRPGHIEVEYGNGWSTPGPAAAVCAKVKARGLPCQVGQEYHGVPKEWSQH